MDRTPSNRNLPGETRDLISRALSEDRVDSDLTTRETVPVEFEATGRIIARENGVLAGTNLLPYLFDQVGGNLKFSLLDDGNTFESGDRVGRLSGRARTLLSGERVALNFLQHLSGIATFTRSFVRKVDDLEVKIVDTRKTTPGWRTLEKRAVRLGGGYNHRMDLSEMAIIKENHLAILRKQDRSLEDVVNELGKTVDVQVEVDSFDQLESVLPASLSFILLDNMTVRETERAVERIRTYESNHDSSIQVEASGGIDLQDVRSYGKTGVDRISIGSLTHSAPAVDFSMNLDV